MTSDSLITTLTHVWQALERAQIDGAVMGGLAVSAWGYFRATRDIDLLIAIELDDWTNAEQRLLAAGFQMVGVKQPKLVDAIHIIETKCQIPEVLWELKVDFLLAETPYRRQAIARGVPFTFPNAPVAIKVLTCEDLILHKLEAGRIRDIADCEQLIAIQRATLDNAYLDAWAAQLGLSAALHDARTRAAEQEID
jgi:hypothetical protein